MDDDISDDIYGDLGDFEFNEKIKEQKEEIASLTERLNQSVVTITDLQNEIKLLKKDKRDLGKNSSSLLLTAKLELSRNKRVIAELQQKIDNRIFRRPNNCSKAVQTDVTTDPSSFHFSLKKDEDISRKQEQHRQAIVDACTVASETLNKCNDPSKFRIPKKNPFARHESEATNQISPCNGNEMEYSHDQRRHNLPKKSPIARCVNRVEDNSIGIHISRSDRNEFDEEKTTRTKHRRDETKDNRRHSPVMHASRRYRDYQNSDDHQRDNGRDDRKHLRSRNSSDEMDSRSKRRRSGSTSNRYRSRSRPSQNAEKRPKTKSPKQSHVKPGKDDRMDPIADLKEKDLEAMLIAQKEILREIASNDSGQQLGSKENSTKERRKRKTSNNVDDSVNQSKNPDKSEDCNSANNDVVVDESKNIVEMLAINTVAINQTDSIASDGSDGHVLVLPSPPCDPMNERKLMEIDGTANNDTKPFSPFRELFLPIKEDTKSTNSIVRSDETAELSNELKSDKVSPVDVVVYLKRICPESMKEQPTPANNSNEDKPLMTIVEHTDDAKPRSTIRDYISQTTEPSASTNVQVNLTKTNHIHNNNDNSNMDIDYELMQRTSGENQSNLSCEEKERQSFINDSPKVTNPIANNDLMSETLPTQTNAPFITMENSVPEGDTTCENVLNSSNERRILTKSSEYTVQDVGHEIRIFLTKKRKKSKKAKVTSDHFMM